MINKIRDAIMEDTNSVLRDRNIPELKKRVRLQNEKFKTQVKIFRILIKNNEDLLKELRDLYK